jgi:hypothetical protein
MGRMTKRLSFRVNPKRFAHFFLDETALHTYGRREKSTGKNLKKTEKAGFLSWFFRSFCIFTMLFLPFFEEKAGSLMA